MIILNSLKLLPHIHGYLFILANTEIYGIKYKTQLSRRHLINSSNVFVIKGFTVRVLIVRKKYTFDREKRKRILKICID